MSKHSVITESAIQEMVHHFYAKVQQDETIGPIFNHAIGERWDAHLARLCAFWSSVLLASKSYYGDPFRTHLMVQGIQPVHFNRWLDLFAETVGELFSEPLAQDIHMRAERMAERMKLMLFDPPPFTFMPPAKPV
jgi:hemoglobin